MDVPDGFNAKLDGIFDCDTLVHVLPGSPAPETDDLNFSFVKFRILAFPLILSPADVRQLLQYGK